MRKKLIGSFIILIVSIIISSVVAEIVVRKIGVFDVDGNFQFKNKKLLPHKLPVKRTEELLKQLDVENWAKAVYVYHPLTGWVNKENYSYNKGGIDYYSTVDGIRSVYQDTLPPSLKGKKFRIALFGDSFTYAQDVTYEESWGNVLQESLKQKGIDNEVLNFGLGGGNMGQAYLMWENIGQKYNPDVVIFGYQEENRIRNFIIVDSMRTFDAGLPFSRPRFFVKNGKLELANSPTITPEQVLEVMKNVVDWEFAGVDRENYRDHFWLKSKFLSLIYTKFKINEFFYKRLPEKSENKNELARAIIKKFQKEVEVKGSKFFVVMIPTGELTNPGIKIESEDFLEKLSQDVNVMIPERIFEEAKNTPINQIFVPHLSAKFNKILGEEFAESFSNKLR